MENTNTTNAQVTDSSVSWASSTPFNVPAYVTGEWGEYVTDFDETGRATFSPNIKDAATFSEEAQKEFMAKYKGTKRFYAAAEYDALLKTADESRGF